MDSGCRKPGNTHHMTAPRLIEASHPLADGVTIVWLPGKKPPVVSQSVDTSLDQSLTVSHHLGCLPLSRKNKAATVMTIPGILHFEENMKCYTGGRRESLSISSAFLNFLHSLLNILIIFTSLDAFPFPTPALVIESIVGIQASIQSYIY